MADSKLSALTALVGADVDPATDLLYVDDVSVTTSKKIIFEQALIGMLASSAAVRFKVGTLTRDWTAASGNVSYTGVGFKPKAIAFIHMTNTGPSMSVGFDDGTTAIEVADNDVTTPGTWASSTTKSISAIQAAGVGQTANVASFDADGFTLAWTKVGSPSGTLQVGYLALR